jgi:hypothetical protein
MVIGDLAVVGISSSRYRFVSLRKSGDLTVNGREIVVLNSERLRELLSEMDV